ncbi:MAG: hypothetical protein R3B12_04390 [Candidatus Saccharimonadales bacterium]
MTQTPTETFSVMAQQLMFEIVLDLEDGELLDLQTLKSLSGELAAKVKEDDSNYDETKAQLKRRAYWR